MVGFDIVSNHSSWDLEAIAQHVATEPKGLSSYVQTGYCQKNSKLVNFITMSEQRSGSTWFKEMLNGHPCLFMYVFVSSTAHLF